MYVHMIEIRYASDNDLKNFIAIVNNDRVGRDRIWSDGYLASLTLDHFNPIFVAVVDWVIVWAISWEVTVKHRQIRIGKLYVCPDNRGSWIGTALINRMEEEVLDRGFDNLSSYIYDNNEESIRLHVKCWFELDGYITHGRRFANKRSKLLIYNKVIQ